MAVFFNNSQQDYGSLELEFITVLIRHGSNRLQILFHYGSIKHGSIPDDTAQSFGPVILLILSFVHLPRLDIPSIRLSIFLWVILSRSLSVSLRDHVSDPNSTMSIKQLSNRRLLLFIGRF